MELADAQPSPMRSLEADQLAPVVAVVLGVADAWPTTWTCRRIGPPVMNPITQGVFAVGGLARTATASGVPWRLVLKVVTDPWFDDPVLDVGYSHQEEDCNYWKRELLVFRSGFLDRYRAGPFVPVRCYAADETRRGEAWLWLEDLGIGTPRARWPVAVHAQAAHDLGVFNAHGRADAAELDAHPWAARHWLRGTVDFWRRMGVGRAAEDPSCWQHPLVRDVLPPDTRSRFARLWSEADGLLEGLESLPTTVSHHDAQWSNLFGTDSRAVPRRTIAVDWSFLGLAPLGQDLGHHVACNLYNRAVDAHQAPEHDLASTTAYLAGLDAAGWRGSVDEVLFARSAAAALQIVPFLVNDLLELADDPTGVGQRPWPEVVAARDHVTVSTVMAHWSRCLTYLLGMGEEAQQLAGHRR